MAAGILTATKATEGQPRLQTRKRLRFYPYLAPQKRMPPLLPSTMRAAQQATARAPLSLVELPVPQPGPGQVLIRVSASPINPSDLSFLAGGYGVKKPFPVVPGFEGSGTVVAAGQGLLPRLWLGRRVACASDNRYDGTWAEYMVTAANRCVPLSSGVSDEQGAMMLVNPLTALAFLDRVRREKYRGIVITAAASALGRMMVRLAQQAGIATIAVVRRAEQLAELQALGATAALNSQDGNFAERMRVLADQYRATLLLDAVAGPLTHTILQAMPAGSVAQVYGNLSMEAVSLPSATLIFEQKRVEGFWLSQVLAQKSFWQAFWDTRRVQRLLSGALHTQVQGRYGLDQAQSAVEQYQAQMSAGKVLIAPR